MVGQKYFKGVGGQTYTKYNKINNNSENFRGQDCCQGAFTLSSPPLISIKQQSCRFFSLQLSSFLWVKLASLAS